MPASRDLKSLFSLHPPLLPTNWPSPQWEWFRALYEVLHKVHTIKIPNPHCFDARNNLCQWLKCAECPRNHNVNKKNSRFELKSALNFKLRHRKAQKMILSGRYGDLYGREGDRCRIRETWHVWKRLKASSILWIVTELYIFIIFCFTLLLHEKQIPILNEQANLNSGCPPR